MYPVSSAYKEAMKKPVQHCKLAGNYAEFQWTEENVLSGSFRITGQCSGDSAVQIGQVFTTELRATFLHNLGVPRNRFRGDVIRPRFGLMVDGGNYEWVPLGQFHVASATWGAAGVEVVAYDDISRLDKAFPKRTILRGTPYEVLDRICRACGAANGMAADDFVGIPNGQRYLVLHTQAYIKTWRDVLAWLAQAVACNAFAGRDGGIFLRPYDRDVVDAIDARQRLTGGHFDAFETGYTGVSVTDTDTNTVSYYGDADDDLTTYDLGANPFLQAAEVDVGAACGEILAALEKVQYVPFSVEMVGNPAYDLMDVLSFSGGIAEDGKLSCLTKYNFVYNGRYSAKGVGLNPALAGALTKTDKDISGLMERGADLSNSINHLIYDYNTSSVEIGQEERTVAVVSYYTSQDADVEGHFLVSYEASEETRVTVRFYDGVVEEIWSPVVRDISAGAGSLDIPHAYLQRRAGTHSARVTLEAYSGTIKADTRRILLTVDAGDYAVSANDIAMDVRDITLRQLMESSGPDQVWVAGIEAGKALVSHRDLGEDQSAASAWEGDYSPGDAVDVALEFDGRWTLRRQSETYTLETDAEPWYFWVDPAAALYAQAGSDEEGRVELATDVTCVRACRGYASELYPDQDQGLVAIYLKTDGHAYYRQYLRSGDSKVWLGESVADDTEIWDDVRVHRLNDYRIGFELSNSTHNVWLISERTYVNQAAPPQLRTDHVGASWSGISVVDPNYVYKGTEHALEGETKQRKFIVDYACPVKLFQNPTEIITTTVNGKAFAEKHTINTEGNQLIIEFEDGISGIVAITVKPWVHYLIGNGINYMFTDPLTYNWEVVSRITAPDQFDVHEDEIAVSSVSILMKALSDISASNEERRSDSFTPGNLIIAVKALSTKEAVPDTENRRDTMFVSSVTIAITQTDDQPI